jgi:hypothetical protein
MLRRVAVLGAGLAMTASVGLAGGGAASAASQASIGNHSKWTAEINHINFCEIETFVTTNKTFTGDYDGDGGIWSGGTTSVKLRWTTGGFNGTKFKGTYNSSSKAFVGHFSFDGSTYPGQLVKGVVVSWNGTTCY